MLRTLARKARRYVRATASKRKLRKLAKSDQIRIVVGASGVYQDGWIGTDADYLDLLKPDDWARWFEPASIDAILAEHVWEHLSPEEGAAAARVCFTFLRPGGYIRAAVPDGLNPNPEYIEHVRPGGVGPGSDDHKILYDRNTFSQCFECAGFRVDLLEYFDESGEFHYFQWDPAKGMIHRSKRFETRPHYSSLILDAMKPSERPNTLGPIHGPRPGGQPGGCA